VSDQRPRPAGLLLALVGLAVLLTACGGDPTSTTRGASSSTDDDAATAVVVRIVDGDTLVVESDGEEDRIRLIGIDTPESVKPGTPVECFGKEASAHLETLVPEGTPVRLERDVEARDRYERLLAYVYRAEDDLFVNQEMVAAGYAQPATYPPNVAHTDELVTAGRRAREQGLGLWSACGGDDLYG
jgi:micrococcal nuclease